MIEGLSIWAEQLIVAVIVATIVEMILPNGNNKKYIKVVIGVYILFTIIHPIIGKITNVKLDELDYEKYFQENDTYQAMSQSLINHNDQSVEEVYISNLKQDMKNKLNEKGYQVEEISLTIQTDSKNYGTINEVNIMLYKKEEIDLEQENNKTNTIQINKVEKVKIGNTQKDDVKGVSKKEIKKSDIEEIKDYLSSVYEIKKKNIKINEEGG